MLLTTDGELAQAMGKRGRVPMTYHLKLQGMVGEDDIERLARGWRWEGAPGEAGEHRSARGDRKEHLDRDGRPESRPRALKAAGDLIRHSLLKISRVRLGGLSFEGLKMGGWRDLTKAEISDLRHRAGLA